MEQILNLPRKDIDVRKFELQQHIGAIQTWLGKGGFRPDWERYPKATQLFQQGRIEG